MKNELIFLLGILLLTSFVFCAVGEPQAEDLGSDVKIGAEETTPLEIVNEIATNLKENLTSNSLEEQQGVELPNFLKIIPEIDTVEEIIIYVAFFVMIFVLIYGIIEIFSNNKAVKGIISGSVTLLFALTGLIQEIINFYLGVDLMTLNYKAISWKIIGVVLGIIVILSVIKIITHKMNVDVSNDQAWWKGSKLRSMLQKNN